MHAGGVSVAANPKVSSSFSKPVQTNDFWSSLIFPFSGSNYSSNLFPHPLYVKATAQGLEMGYTTSVDFPASDYLFPYSKQLTVGVQSMNASRTTTDDYGDWTATALWEDGSKKMKATFGHCLPFVYYEINGGNANIITSANPTIWFQKDEVLGITVDGKHYGIFAPIGSTWSGISTFISSLNEKNYLSVALLPDNRVETLELFRKHAYSFVTNSEVSWVYDEPTAKLTTTFTYTTEQKETGEDLLEETLTALYRHQWLYTKATATNYTYTSARGTMKLMEGNEFSTEIIFNGIVPSLPDVGDYNREILKSMVVDVANETLPVGPTYENGKLMSRYANVISIADQLGAFAERDKLLIELKKRLEDWLTAGGSQQYYYNEKWNVLTGYPSGYGADDQINDHHFHASYAVHSAATVAQYDPDWAKPENWGGMINLLIKDSNNWDRTDNQFPFLRNHDSYAGHSWAAGHGDFADGNNQESSSESMNFASAVFLWGANTHQKEVRDLGIFLHTNETTAIEQYWFDVNNQVFPSNYNFIALGMVWGRKGVHSTWFGNAPEFIHGINLLPVTSGSLYLGRHPEYVKANYAEVVKEVNGQPTLWKDIFWEYLALSDPNQALSLYYADVNYTPFDGESRAHTLHWLGNLKKLGHLDTTITATIPTYSVFRDANDALTYVVYNPNSEELVAKFSDGYELSIPARKMKSESTSQVNDESPIVILTADVIRGKLPLTVNLTASKSFDKYDSPISFKWDFGTGDSGFTADTAYTFTEAGVCTIKLTVTNEKALSTSDSVSITVLSNGTPYSGTPVAIPVTIEAEKYDLGGEGVAFHDVDANNIGQLFRLNEGVDLEFASDQTYNVYWMVAGEWLEYTINVPEDGLYDITPYVATVPGFGNFKLSVNTIDLSGKINVLNTGGFQTWKPITVTDVTLKAGTQILHFDVDSDSDKNGWLFSLNKIEISKAASVSNKLSLLPDQFELRQNFPNPFNPSTTIGFSLPKASVVELSIYNAVGQRIQVLSQAVYQAGKHEITFDASPLSSGMYFYQLKSESGTATKKMMLMK